MKVVSYLSIAASRPLNRISPASKQRYFDNFFNDELNDLFRIQVADQGVKTLFETAEQGEETDTPEGVKTVELLFKLGAECLERYALF